MTLSLPHGVRQIRHPASLLYGVIAYLAAVRSMLYLVGFSTGWLVPKTIDSGAVSPATIAVAVDVALLTAFGGLHSLTARSAWKRRLERHLPAGLERSTYVLIAALSLSALFWLWRPLPEPVWTVATPWLAAASQGVSAAGWLICLVAVHTLGHFELFGLAPAWRYATGRRPKEVDLVRHGLYARVRNPLYLGFLLGVWATPRMSRGHLLFAALATGYIAVGLVFEERDLARRHGADYRAFEHRVPRFLPRLRPAQRRPDPS